MAHAKWFQDVPRNLPKLDWKKRHWAQGALVLALAAIFYGLMAAKNFGSGFRIFVEPTSNNLATGLVDEMRYWNLTEMEAAGLKKAELSQQPWSDSYWPIYKGSLANRYNDPEFPDSIDWKQNTDYVISRLGQGNPETWSPAEKYDVLVGDRNFTLTKKSISDGRPYYERNREVETWMGLCHGWAPAAFMEKRPQEKVVAKSADGRLEIPFFPSDIKALATLLWAKGWNTSTRFISKRCNIENPTRDPTGRPLQAECLDTNAATWHLSVVNQIGYGKRSFVLDATPDYEVWNHPVLGYSYSYVHPKTKQVSTSIEGAKLALAEYRDDPRPQYRAKEAVDLVGIKMNVRYVVETYPSDRISDSAAFDSVHEVTYQYELELDPSGKIVGGEWVSSLQPDFLWTETKRSVPHTAGDQRLDQLMDQTKWPAGESIPQSWKTASVQSANAGQPLRRIVRGLIDQSQRR